MNLRHSFPFVLEMLISMLLIPLAFCEAAQNEDRAYPEQRISSESLSVYKVKADDHSGFSLHVELDGGSEHAVIAKPVSIEVVHHSGDEEWYEQNYSNVSVEADSLKCTGSILTQNGTVFSIEDVYSFATSGSQIHFNRTLEIHSPSAKDVAFSSRFRVQRENALAISKSEVFVPGIWYRDNQHIPPLALAGDLSHDSFLFREDRLPLPVLMIRDPRSGFTFSLGHVSPDGRTFSGDAGLKRVVDDRMQFGSLGLQNNRNPSLIFLFPGTEGERSYIGGRSDTKRWASRSHPVKVGVQHEYRLLIGMSKSSSFPEAMSRTWRECFSHFDPPLFRVQINKIYIAGVELLNKYWTDFDGVPGFPFSVGIPHGRVDKTSLQMGFVGQQIPAAVHLIRFGMERNRPRMVLRGESIIDFWTKHSLTPSGIPKTWYDVRPNRWRDYKTFLRIACDGSTGVLNGWDLMRRKGQNRNEWLAFCEKFGEWLVSNQNQDGSFFRQYDFKGDPVQKSKFNSTHPIRFLVDLSKATGAKKYLNAAVRAGEFCHQHVHSDFKYVGGTPDNPDVVDKEAGLIALDAFLALYDATNEKKWLECAVQAADFSETWLYCWDVPMIDGDKECDFPKQRGTTGLSLIATGHSGADTFMAYYPFSFYRLYLYTGDQHFRKVAELLLFNTKQIVDLDGSLGYSVPGLQTEAMTLAVRRGHSVGVWLPWLTVASIDPLIQLRDTFGAMEISDIENQGLEKLKEKNQEYGATRGFFQPQKSEEAVSAIAYLDDLKEASSSVGHGVLGKNGRHGYGNAPVKVNGEEVKHSLSLHPPKKGSSHVSYNLGGAYKEFSVGVGISDSAQKPSGSPLVFRVVGDGKTLWKSTPIRKKGSVQKCNIDIDDVKEIKLMVDCSDGNAWAFAVWINPLIKR